MKRTISFFAALTCISLLSLPTICTAQTCLPPSDISIALQVSVGDITGQPVDSVYVQWLPAPTATAYHYEVLIDGEIAFFNTTVTTQFNFSILPMGWNIAEVRLQTACIDGSESDWRAAAIVATVDEVYKIYQTGDCAELGVCSECLCHAVETLLEDTSAINGVIENNEYLGDYGCAPFLNRFLQSNIEQLMSVCPCFIPKQACYDSYPCNGFNCPSTGLREASSQTFSWRVQNNAAKGSIIIEYAINVPNNINFYMYDLYGNRIKTISPDDTKTVGQHRTEVHLPRQGVYVIELQVANTHEFKKIIALW